MTRAASFAAGIAVTAFAALAGLVALALFALADTDIDLPDQCDATIDPITTGYFGPRLRCQEFADHDGDHRHTYTDGLVVAWGSGDA